MALECPILDRPACEPQDLMTDVCSMALRAIPIHPGQFKGSVSSIAFDDVTLEFVHTHPVLLLGNAAENRSGILLMLEGRGEAKWNGAPIGAGQAAVFRKGCPIAVASHAALNCAIVSFTGLEAAGPLPPQCQRSQQNRPEPVIQVDKRVFARMTALAYAADGIASPVAGIRDLIEAFRTQWAPIQDEVRNLFVPSHAAGPQPRYRPPFPAQIVRRTDDYLQANWARAIYTDDLCSALGVSESSLQKAFLATFGLSPHRYLKLRRMTVVRATLLSGSDRWHSVKAAALSYGFWHLGQFAHDYRILFGESPSETLARTP
jgi:AraC-like DNA-binding protein